MVVHAQDRQKARTRPDRAAVGEWLLPVASHSLISFARYQAGNLYFALAIPALLQPRPLLRGLSWMLFGMVLAWYASTYPFGNWAS